MVWLFMCLREKTWHGVAKEDTVKCSLIDKTITEQRNFYLIDKTIAEQRNF